MEFREYLVLAVAVGAMMGVLGALSHPDFAKEVRSMLGVIALFALMAPIASLLSSGLQLPSFDEIPIPDYGDGYAELTVAAYEDGLCRAIAERMSIDSSGVSVALSDVDLSSMRAGRVSVVLDKQAILVDVRSLREWLREEFVTDGGNCEVVIQLE